MAKIKLSADGCPAHLPPTTDGLLMIPLAPYKIPEESRKGVTIEAILPSGVTEDMVCLSVIHQG